MATHSVLPIISNHLVESHTFTARYLERTICNLIQMIRKMGTISSWYTSSCFIPVNWSCNIKSILVSLLSCTQIYFACSQSIFVCRRAYDLTYLKKVSNNKWTYIYIRFIRTNSYKHISQNINIKTQHSWLNLNNSLTTWFLLFF